MKEKMLSKPGNNMWILLLPNSGHEGLSVVERSMNTKKGIVQVPEFVFDSVNN